MKINNHNYTSVQDLNEHLNLTSIDTKKTVIQIFCGLLAKENISELCQVIKSKKEDVKFIGTTTAGEIFNGDIGYEGITVSIMEFENTSFENAYFKNDNNLDLGVDIATSLFKDNTKVMILFIEGLLHNGNDVLDGISSINSTIPISGGMAGDNGAFSKTFIFDNNGIYENGAVAVTLNSDVLDVLTNYQLNWQPIGKTMTVTKADKNRLYEIDGISASDIYRKYLGDKIGDDLPHSAIEFPLLKIEDDGLEVCRTFVHKFDEDGSLLTIGNLEVGDKVRLAFGNVDLIINGVNHDIQNYKSFQPEAIFTYSCTARVTFLQSDVVRELKPLNDIAPIAGFFTYGEIYHHDNKNSLLNISLTILGLSENTNQNVISFNQEEEISKEKNFIKNKHFMVLDALSHLSNTVIDELDQQKALFQNLFDAAPDAIVLFNEKGLFEDTNEAALSVFGVNSKEELLSLRPDKLSPEFQENGKTSFDCMNENIQLAIKKGRHRFEWIHVRPLSGETFYADVVLAPFMFNNSPLIYAIVRDINERKEAEKKLETAKLEIESIHKHTQDSIEYASLIQGALIPEQTLLKKYFKDYFTIWEPKDVVGGDIYLFEELREKDECLLMVIDCTGHGVPGAFVTMLVKAIERQVISKIENDKSIDVSPAWILSYFNRTMKKLLKQEDENSISNAGFDGGIIYYNKKENIIKFAGAETPLFYIEDNELKTLKGNRHSIGYKKCDINYEYKEHTIEVKDEMKFYLTTDGYLDQNGGEKGFPFGKSKFKELIVENSSLKFENQKEILLSKMKDYMQDEERNDDTTVVGIEVSPSVTTLLCNGI